MDTATTAPRRITGLTISCDKCDRRAAYRAEAPAANGAGFDVFWTCTEHTTPAAA
jgi:hypothetical protein